MKLTAIVKILAICFGAILFSIPVSAQQSAGQPALPPMPQMPEPPPPSALTKANSPRPEPAQRAILDLFNKYEVVGMNVDHGQKDLDDFILDLVRNPEFPNKVQDIAVECGNSLYQPIIDRYIAGEDVPFTQIHQAYGDTTNPQCGLIGFYAELFQLVRQVNKHLSSEKKLRVLAGDPPLDWSKIQNLDDRKKQHAGNRDQVIASVMEKEVLSKHRKALMLFGTFHLFHGQSAVAIYEKDYPGVTYVVHTHTGFGQDSPAAKYDQELEQRMASWPVPSFVNIKGTWLADLDFSYFFPPIIIANAPGVAEYHWGYPSGMSSFSKAVDGFLYFGPPDLLLREHIPANIVMNKDFMTELQRKKEIMNEMPGMRSANPIDGALDSEKSTSELLFVNDSPRSDPAGTGPKGQTPPK